MLARHSVPAAAALLLAARAGDSPGEQRPLTPSPPSATRAAAIAIVCGNDQLAKAGEQLGAPFVVRVTDIEGNGVGDVGVSFSLTSGVGTLAGDSPGPPGAPITATAQTNANGLAQMTFEPTEVGRIAVTAEVAGSRVGRVTFTADATVLVIKFFSMRFDPYSGFVGPCSCFRPVTVPVGTTVEWKSLDEAMYTVTSASTPQGGTAFDSGTLTMGSRFRFVPAVAGTWQYHDKLSGLMGTLTAR